jgi:multidrug efflux pump subunit AcrA (membrane-fusion protein)
MRTDFQQAGTQAPATVEQAREQARDAAQQAREQARDAAQQARQEARAQADQARAQADLARVQAQEAVDQAQRQMQDAFGRGRSGLGPVFPPLPGGRQIPDGAVVMTIAFFVMCAVIAIGYPLARAFGRRIDRKSVMSPNADPDTRARLERIEQAVDAIAVEVERISEGQRFTTKVIADLKALPLPDASAGVGDRQHDRSPVPLSRAREAR